MAKLSEHPKDVFTFEMAVFPIRSTDRAKKMTYTKTRKEYINDILEQSGRDSIPDDYCRIVPFLMYAWAIYEARRLRKLGNIPPSNGGRITVLERNYYGKIDGT